MTQFENTYLGDANLRVLYAPIFNRRVASRGSCPSGESILAVVRRNGDEVERLQTLDHVMSCGLCRSDFDVLQTVDYAGQSLVREAGGPVVSRGGSARSVNSANLINPGAARRWSYPILAFAACTMIAIGVGSHLTPDGSGERVERGAGESVSLLSPVESTMVDPSVPVIFAWNAIPRVIEYHFELLDSAGRIIISAVTSDTTIVFANLQDQIDPGLAYRWWVRSLMPSGEFERSEMRLIRFPDRAEES